MYSMFHASLRPLFNLNFICIVSRGDYMLQVHRELLQVLSHITCKEPATAHLSQHLKSALAFL